MDYQPPPFFVRGPAPMVRMLFFASLALMLMVLDARFHQIDGLRQALAVIAYPMQRVASVPFELMNNVADFFTSQVTLKRDNDELKSKMLQASNDLLTIQGLAAENAQMRRLLDARERLPRQSTFAEILYTGRDPFSRKVVIDKGSQQGIQAGQGVIDDLGLIGQVTRVYPLLAEVTLITDKEQPTPIQILRTGLRAVVYGGGDSGALDLRYMVTNVDIQNGDVLVTSGIDGTYPPELPVAKVERVERDAAFAFAKIICVPAAGISRYKQVLVLSQEAKLPPPPAESNSAVKTTKSKRPRAAGR